MTTATNVGATDLTFIHLTDLHLLATDDAQLNGQYPTQKLRAILERIRAMEITPATVKSHNPNPQGFLKGVRYEHWDTLYGYVDSGGIEYAKVGQVYGASLFGDGTPQGQYQQYQDIPWNTQWLAIGSWNGIVW